MYWIYDIPTWLLGVLTVAVFLFFSLGGLLLSHGIIRGRLMLSNETNNAVCGYIGGIGAVLGLLLGFVAVATWQAFNNAASLATREAAEVGSLYLDVSSYPQPYAKNMQEILKTYLTTVIDTEWPAQMRGQVAHDAMQHLHRLHHEIFTFEPQTINQQVLQAEVFHALNNVLSARRMRLDAVDDGLPAPLWYVVLIGSVVSIATTYFFHFPNFKVHVILTGKFALFTGIMVFLIAAVDNPFRGEVSISPDLYRMMLASWSANP